MSFYGNQLMNNCVMDGNYPSYYATYSFLERAYFYLNGRINKIRSIGLKMDDFSSTKDSMIMGFNCVASTNLFPYNITSLLVKLINNGLQITEESYKGYLLLIVAHELSHISQVIDYVGISNKEDKTDSYVNLERANDGNAIMYLINNQDTLQSLFGKFDFELIFKIKTMIDPKFMQMQYADKFNPFVVVKDDSKEYKEFTNADDKIKILLQDMYQASVHITDDDTFDYISKDCNSLFNGNIQNIQCSFTNKDGYTFSKEVYKNNEFDESYSNLRFLSEMFNSSYFITHPLLYYPQYNLLLIRRDHSSKESKKELVYIGEGQ